MTESLPNESVRSHSNHVSLKGSSPYLGTRSAAKASREALAAIVRRGAIARADADGVAVMTPAYAEECFGLLFEQIGEEEFKKSVRFVNGSEACDILVEAVLERRAGPGNAPPPVEEVAPIKTLPAASDDDDEEDDDDYTDEDDDDDLDDDDFDDDDDDFGDDDDDIADDDDDELN